MGIEKKITYFYLSIKFVINIITVDITRLEKKKNISFIFLKKICLK